MKQLFKLGHRKLMKRLIKNCKETKEMLNIEVCIHFEQEGLTSHSTAPSPGGASTSSYLEEFENINSPAGSSWTSSVSGSLGVVYNVGCLCHVSYLVSWRSLSTLHLMQTGDIGTCFLVILYRSALTESLVTQLDMVASKIGIGKFVRIYQTSLLLGC